jgi:hypothetical protein
MLPEPEDDPSGVAESFCGFGVARNVFRELLGPVGRVRLGAGPMLRARMPVAAVDEDRDPPLREYDVRRPPQGRFRAVVDAVAKSGGVQKPTNGEFGSGVSGPVSLHDLPRGRAARPTLVRRHRSIFPRNGQREQPGTDAHMSGSHRGDSGAHWCSLVLLLAERLGLPPNVLEVPSTGRCGPLTCRPVLFTLEGLC